MEGQEDVKPDAPRIGKRPLAARTCTGLDSKPRKLRPSPKSSPSAVNSFQMESRVHDVEEHFRRSFQQMNNRPHPLKPVVVSSSDTVEGSSIAMATTTSDSHQIIIKENVSPQQQETTPTPEETTPVPSPASTSGSTHQQLEGSPSRSTTRVASSPNLVSPQQQGAPPPLLFSMPGGSLTADTLKTVKSYNEVLSLAATQQLITAATLGQSVGSTGGRGGVIFPNILPIAASQSNFIPVVDGNGVTQLMASPAAHPSSTNNTLSQTPQTTPPLVFLGPGGIPLLPAAAASTQPSMYLVNMSADLASLQQQQQQNQPQRSPATITTPPSLSTTGTQPSYIVFPPSFQMPQSLTLEQLQSLSTAFQQRQQEQQQVAESRQIEVPSKQTSSGSSSDNVSIRSPINHHNGGDEVEEHFARALGEKWHQYKKEGNPFNKIST